MFSQKKHSFKASGWLAGTYTFANAGRLQTLNECLNSISKLNYSSLLSGWYNIKINEDKFKREKNNLIQIRLLRDYTKISEDRKNNQLRLHLVVILDTNHITTCIKMKKQACSTQIMVWLYSTRHAFGIAVFWTSANTQR